MKTKLFAFIFLCSPLVTKAQPTVPAEHAAAIHQITNEDDVAVFPNPARSYLVINATFRIDKITISNLLGQVLRTYEFDAQTARIDINEFPQGLYQLRVNGIMVRKFSKY